MSRLGRELGQGLNMLITVLLFALGAYFIGSLVMYERDCKYQDPACCDQQVKQTLDILSDGEYCKEK